MTDTYIDKNGETRSVNLKYPQPDYCRVCGEIQFGVHYHDLPEDSPELSDEDQYYLDLENERRAAVYEDYHSR